MQTIKDFLTVNFQNAECIGGLNQFGDMKFTQARFQIAPNGGLFNSVGMSKAVVWFSIPSPSTHCHGIALVVDDMAGDKWAAHMQRGENPEAHGLTHYRPSPVLRLAAAC